MSFADHVERNVRLWTRVNEEFTDTRAREAWARDIGWGVFHVAESELGVLGDVAALDVVELGCGTAYFSAWLTRAGARSVGVDPTPAQLETARRMQAETGLAFPLVEAAAEDVPLADASFDLALSEYGASIWADPYRWIPEAARLLRVGGRLVFLRNSTLVVLCLPERGVASTQLQRPLFGLYRLEWADEESVEFQLPHGPLIALLRDSGFDVEGLIEVQAPEGATDPEYYDYVTAEWARQWPCEEIWVARKRR